VGVTLAVTRTVNEQLVGYVLLTLWGVAWLVGLRELKSALRGWPGAVVVVMAALYSALLFGVGALILNTWVV
jgi:hypothetical protein